MTTTEQTRAMGSISNVAEDLETIIEIRCPPSREKSLAIVKLEECVMWADKCLAGHGVWTDCEGC